MLRILISVLSLALTFQCAAHHGEQLLVSVFRKTEKLAAFIPSCGHDLWDIPRGSFFVVANPDVTHVLESGYSPKDEFFVKHVAVNGRLLDDSRVGYDGVMFLSSAVEIDVGYGEDNGFGIPCS